MSQFNRLLGSGVVLTIAGTFPAIAPTIYLLKAIAITVSHDF